MADIGIPDDEGLDDIEILPRWELKIADWFPLRNTACDYEYDFGDGWHHSIVLDSILPRERGVAYPMCVAGASPGASRARILPSRTGSANGDFSRRRSWAECQQL